MFKRLGRCRYSLAQAGGDDLCKFKDRVAECGGGIGLKRVEFCSFLTRQSRDWGAKRGTASGALAVLVRVAKGW